MKKTNKPTLPYPACLRAVVCVTFVLCIGYTVIAKGSAFGAYIGDILDSGTPSTSSTPAAVAGNNASQSPAIGSDEDFPALAPPAPKAQPKSVETRKKGSGGQSKPKSGDPESEAVECCMEEDVEEVRDERKIQGKNVWGQQQKKKPVDSIQTPIEPPQPQAAGKKQSLRMMRILSKDSVTSVAPLSSDTPGKSLTPSTESLLHFSDTASILSGTTESRPVSPPPTLPPRQEPATASMPTAKKKAGVAIVGPESADQPLVVSKSKSALKKERIAAQKEKERKAADEAAAAKARDVQAPISARKTKKKERKAAANKRGDDSTKDHDDTGSERPEDSASVAGSNRDDDRRGAGMLEEMLGGDENQQRQQQQQQQAQQHWHKPAANATPAQLVAEITAEESIDWRESEMFKPLNGLKGGEYHISAEDIAKIRASFGVPAGSLASANPSAQLKASGVPHAIHLSLRGGGSFETPILITQQGTVLRGLTPQQELRYVEMENRRSAELAWQRWGSATVPNIADFTSASTPPMATAIATTTATATSSSSSYSVEKTADWRAAVAAHSMAAGLAVAGNVARNMQLGTVEGDQLNTKDALDYLWNTVMPALPCYAQEHLEGLAHKMAMSGCKVSVGFDSGGISSGGAGEQMDGGGNSGSGNRGSREPTVTLDVKLEGPSIKGLPKLGGLGVKELEKLMLQSRKETEVLEKKLEKLIKRNRKIVGLC